MQDEVCAYIVNTETGLTVGTNTLGEKISYLYQKRVPEEVIVNDYPLITKEVLYFLRWLKKYRFSSVNIKVIPINTDIPSLLQVQLDLAWDCNLACRHCYLQDKKLIAPHLSLEEWLDIVNQLYELQVPKIAILGGEPILSPIFYKVANYVSGKGFKLYTTTNGTLISKDVAQKIYDAGFTEIDVSLDGGTPESHEFLRGKNTFKRTLRGIELLAQQGLKVKTATVLSRVNFSEFRRMTELGSKLGVSEMYFNSLMPCGKDRDIWDDIGLTIKEWGKLLAIMNQWNQDDRSPRLFMERMFNFEHLKVGQNLGDVFNLVKHNITQGGCKAGKREVIISPDGFLVICPLVSTERSFHTTNVRDTTIAYAWRHDYWIKKLREVDEGNIKGKCKICPHRVICKGGCHLTSLFESGSLYNPDPRCPY